MTGERIEQLSVLIDKFCNMIGSFVTLAIIEKTVDLRFGQAKNFSQLTGNSIVFHFAVSGQQSNAVFMFFSVRGTVKNVINHIIALVRGEIDIKVGRVSALRIDKPFEVQI